MPRGDYLELCEAVDISVSGGRVGDFGNEALQLLHHQRAVRLASCCLRFWYYGFKVVLKNGNFILFDKKQQLSSRRGGRILKKQKERYIMLGARIATLRHKANLSQKKLAERLHISPSAVGMYEQGRREPSIDILVAIAQEFRVTIDFLVLGKPHI